MNAIAPWFAGFLAGAIAGAIAASFFLWTAARARWLEREAQIEADREREAKVTRWREEAIRRGMLHELQIRESSARLLEVPLAEPLKIARKA